jgi:hypothetical protein
VREDPCVAVPGVFKPQARHGHVLMERLSHLGRSPRVSHSEASLLVPDEVRHWCTMS